MDIVRESIISRFEWRGAPILILRLSLTSAKELRDFALECPR